MRALTQRQTRPAGHARSDARSGPFARAAAHESSLHRHPTPGNKARPVPASHSSPVGPQMKLAVSTPGDAYEQEADRVAGQVMRMPAPPAQNKPCACGGSCPRCKASDEPVLAASGPVGHMVQRFSRCESGPADVSAAVARGTSGGGRPLDGDTRTFMESRFGRDLSQVRVHTGAAAERSAQELDALAYTMGRDIVFSAGQLSPATYEGRRLLAHELTHVVQQAGGNGADQVLAVSPAPSGQVARQPAAPVYGAACSGGANDPCQLARCSADQQNTINLDIARGLRYVNAAVAALAKTPLSDFTARAMDWYFGGHDQQTVATVSARMTCVATSLASPTFGCDPPHDALAYTCAHGAGFCGHLAEDICFTKKHFDENARHRAITAIHEAAHLEGMSTGSPQTNPDIYEWEMRFLDMSPSQAVQNADSYALFAAVIGSDDQPSTVLLTLSAGAGVALSPHADPTWYYKSTLGVEWQHPRLWVFHPTLSAGFMLIGDTVNPETGVHAPTTELVSVLGGLRIGKSRRPGEGGGLEVSLFGGPAISIAKGKQTEIGAEVGAALGYRWRMLDFSVGVDYASDPLRSPAQHVTTVGGTFSLNL